MRLLYLSYSKTLIEQLQPGHPVSGQLLREMTDSILYLPEGEDFIKQNSETWLNAPEGNEVIEEWGIHPRTH